MRREQHTTERRADDSLLTMERSSECFSPLLVLHLRSFPLVVVSRRVLSIFVPVDTRANFDASHLPETGDDAHGPAQRTSRLIAEMKDALTVDTTGSARHARDSFISEANR